MITEILGLYTQRERLQDGQMQLENAEFIRVQHSILVNHIDKIDLDNVKSVEDFKNEAGMFLNILLYYTSGSQTEDQLQDVFDENKELQKQLALNIKERERYNNELSSLSA